MKKLTERLRKLLVAAGLISVFVLPAFAQVQDNLDLGNLAAAVTSSTPLAAGTTNFTPTPNSQGKGALCQLHQVSSAGSATLTYAIQTQDAASNTWNSLITSSSITAVTDTWLAVYPGMQTSSLPSGWTAISLHLPRVWRIQAVVGGTGTPQWNITIGCNLLN